MTVRVPAELVHRQILTVLTAWGMPRDLAETTAGVMVETDLRGVDSHGINMLRQYDETFRRGALNVRARPKLLRDRPASALLDAGHGLGHPVSVEAMTRAIEKARSCDIAMVCVVNSHHFGAAGHYAELAARAGMIGLVTTSSRSITMVPTRGLEPVLGTNPFALAAPAGRHPPLVLDFATTVAAVNRVRVRHLRGLELPEGWVTDGDGRPVRDAGEALEIFTRRSGGGLNPIGGAGEILGGHKGYGLALFSHLLGGTLPGASFSPVRVRTQKREDPDRLGHWFQVINPEAFRPADEFLADVDEVIDTLKASRPADPDLPVLVAGEPERLTREDRLRDGIPLPDALCDIVRRLAGAAGVPYLLDGRRDAPAPQGGNR